MRKRVLVVDDDPHVLCLLSHIVEQAGYEVVSAENGADALTALKDQDPDLVVLDLLLPGISGFRICERIRAKGDRASIKVLAITGVGTAQNRRRIMALGADAYVTKPVDVKEFSETVAQLVSAV